MEDEEECNVGLDLGLGVGKYVPSRERQKGNKPMVCLDLSFRLCRKEEAENIDLKEEDENYAKNKCYPNNHIKTGSRKKLRLTKEQSSLLEESFKLHSTLNPAQKQALAEQLNLTARQVEVWFQNRRARTKLKQTEVDYEFLKKCCESLSDENRRLKKELQELRSLKAGQSPLYIQLPKATTFTMCPSCEKIGRTSEGKSAAVFDVVLKNNKSQSGFGGAT